MNINNNWAWKSLQCTSVYTLIINQIVCFRRSDGDTKAAESNKRKLSADLNLTKSHLDIKKRDGM